jgi:predicted butyrate kinase (DUF1464 family)
MKIFIGDYPEEYFKRNEKRKVEVEISDHDLYSLDNTLAYIIAPALKEFKKSLSGAPFVHDEDVPEELRSTSAAPKDEFYFKRWEWVLDEMIYAFESKNNDWELTMRNWDERDQINKRIKNGYRLFGKYYECLWN